MTDDHRVEAMRKGESISLRSDWRVISHPFLVYCFLFLECKEMKLIRNHFRNKCTVPLLLNPCIPEFRNQILEVAISGLRKGTPS